MAGRAQRGDRIAGVLVCASLLGACGGSTGYSGNAAPETASGTPSATGPTMSTPVAVRPAATLAEPIGGTTGGTTGGTAGTGTDGTVGGTLGGTGGGSGDPLVRLEDDPGLLTAIPEIVLTEVLADSGLQVAYTDAAQLEAIAPDYVGAQWQHMQSCTGVTAPPPVVVVVAGAVAPFVATDDVIRDITGRSIASASVTSAGTVVQITADDLDPATLTGVRGFTLRAILGRTLWLGANLAERDYPFSCARTDPTLAASAAAPGG